MKALVGGKVPKRIIIVLYFYAFKFPNKCIEIQRG
jgi:hypothetical protein